MKKIILIFVCILVLNAISACETKRVDDSNHNIADATEPAKVQQNNVNDETEPHISDLENDSSNGEPTVTEPTVTEPDCFTAFGGINFKLYESGEYYELYGQVYGTGTYYEVWNTEGILIDFGFQHKGGEIEQNGKLLQLSMSCGTYCQWVKYFDIQNNRVSRFFNNPLATNDNLVVYTCHIGDDYCVVIENIFDQTAFYKAIPMVPVPNSAVQFEATFIDSLHVQMTYSTDDGEITQIYNIETGEGTIVS